MVKAQKILLLQRLRLRLTFHATANRLEDALDLRPIATLIYVGSTPVAPTLGGPKGSAPRRGETALHWAAAKGHRSIVELLLKHGADVEAKNNKGPGPRGKSFREFTTARGQLFSIGCARVAESLHELRRQACGCGQDR